MKIARISCMVLGIAFLIFVIAPYASAQAITGEWFKGKASLKGYEISGTAIVGKAGGGTTIYVNIVGDNNTTDYTVTTCVQDRLDDTWQLGLPTVISGNVIYGDPNSGMVWDFNESGMLFAGPIVAYPMFFVKINGDLTKASFKSFACALYDDANAPNFQLGSCNISFKNIDAAKVPRGAAGCIITP